MSIAVEHKRSKLSAITKRDYILYVTTHKGKLRHAHTVQTGGIS
jgi:hypothetical protein